MKSSKQKTFEEWMGEFVDGCHNVIGAIGHTRRSALSIPRYNYAKEVWAAAGGKFDGDDEGNSHV